jgi:2-polyprenyl-3-methyl-5-hydroxy-6-metoxy-1,4-benzoquinol methylase
VTGADVERAAFTLRDAASPFSSIRDNAVEVLHLLEDAASVLDVGCGKASPLRFLRTGRLVGVDAYAPDVDEARRLRTHDEVVQSDIRSICNIFHAKQFDVCVALDVIEHLTREEALSLLREMESVACRRVVVSTPNGFLPQGNKEAGDLQVHQSGWSVDEMRGLGYQVIGLMGLKTLRGEQHKLRFRPVAFWALVSWISQKIWCKRHPARAAGLLCWKDV